MIPVSGSEIYGSEGSCLGMVSNIVVKIRVVEDFLEFVSIYEAKKKKKRTHLLSLSIILASFLVLTPWPLFYSVQKSCVLRASTQRIHTEVGEHLACS